MTDAIDAALAAALIIRREDRAAFDDDPSRTHTVWQTSSIDALLDGAYEGDLTLGELAAHGDLGIGTIQQLDGELILLDGQFFTVAADGTVHEMSPTTLTPFAVVCAFAPSAPVVLDGPLALLDLTATIDAAAPATEPVVAVRVDGRFRELHLRSVPKQRRPYKPLQEVVAQQTDWHVQRASGTLVGFRFPASAQGIDVAGYHLHFLSDDRTVGGHVIDLTLEDGILLIDGAHDLHLEIPAGVRIGGADTSAAKAAAIRAVEGGE